MSYILEAHRGVSSDYPENTMSAYLAAYRLGYGMIELDTKFTADNRCVLLHDRTLMRTARNADGSMIAGDIRIDEITLAEARRYNYGSWKDEKFRGEPIPTLEDVLELAGNYKIPLKFDNVVQSHTPEQRRIFFDTIESAGMAECVGFTGSDIGYIREVLSRFPSAYIHYDGPVTEDAMDELAKIVMDGRLTVWMRFDNKITSWNKNAPVTAESAAWVKERAKLGVWLLTEDEELDTAVNLYRADVVETDGRIKPPVK